MWGNGSTEHLQSRWELLVEVKSPTTSLWPAPFCPAVRSARTTCKGTSADCWANINDLGRWPPTSWKASVKNLHANRTRRTERGPLISLVTSTSLHRSFFWQMVDRREIYWYPLAIPLLTGKSAVISIHFPILLFSRILQKIPMSSIILPRHHRERTVPARHIPHKSTTHP